MKIASKISQVIIRGIIGLVIIYFFNMYLDTYDFTLGINIYNGLIVGILGFPGLIMLYVLVLFDKKVF